MALTVLNFESAYLHSNTEVSIILPDRSRTVAPEAFYQKGIKYPVLWLLHGTYGDHSDWVRHTNIELYARERDLIAHAIASMAGHGCRELEPKAIMVFTRSGRTARILSRMARQTELHPLLTEETEEGWEGCLSVPGLRGMVARHTNLRYRGFDLDGRPIDRTVTGFHARVVQHEVDHLDGILYPMRVVDLRSFGFEDELFPDRSALPPD